MEDPLDGIKYIVYALIVLLVFGFVIFLFSSKDKDEILRTYTPAANQSTEQPSYWSVEEGFDKG